MALGHGRISNTRNDLAYYDTTGFLEDMIIENVHKKMLFFALVIVTIYCLNGSWSLPYQLHEECSSLL
jgi:hypothetical protein